MSDGFSTEHFDGDGGYGSDPGAASPQPYDEPLQRVARALPRLRRLDLGYGDPEMARYFWDYCCSGDALEGIQAEHPALTLTMADERVLPHEWADGEEGAQRATMVAFNALAEDEDEGLREYTRALIRKMMGEAEGSDDDDDDDDGESGEGDEDGVFGDDDEDGEFGDNYAEGHEEDDDAMDDDE